MVRTIDFCIPFVADGIRYLEHLINNIERTAAQLQRINIIVSYHTDDDFNALNKSPVYKKISQTVFAPIISNEVKLYASANHASAINTLAKASSADIVIFSDYDMAFVYPRWDNLIERYFFEDNLQLCGVTYNGFVTRIADPNFIERVPIVKNRDLAKYQNLPNLSFMGIRGDLLRQTFSSRMTHFDEFPASGGVPFRLIDTPELAAENNLPLGFVQWLDTGYELPALIQRHHIPYAIFPHVMLDQQNVLQDHEEYEKLHVMYRPEVFYCQTENAPFLSHFKKGTVKAKDGSTDVAFTQFKAAIDNFLSGL